MSTTSTSMEDAIVLCRRFCALVRSDNTMQQFHGARGLWELSCTHEANAVMIGRESGLRALVHVLTGLVDSGVHTGLVVSQILGALWNLSAYAENKVLAVEEGVLPSILILTRSTSKPLRGAASAILQNISESRFAHGERNPHQVRIVEEGAIEALLPLTQESDLPTRFRACLTIANLAMHPLNRTHILMSGGLNAVRDLLASNLLVEEQSELWSNWLVLQPFVPLLQGDIQEVQALAVMSLRVFVRMDKYKMQLWRDLALNGGVQPLRDLSLSDNEHIRQAANEVIHLLGMEERTQSFGIASPALSSDIHYCLASGMFADVAFRVEGRVLRAHKGILAARCPPFRALFTCGMRESAQAEILITDLSYSAFAAVLEFIYSDKVTLDTSSVMDVLRAADMYTLDRLKNICEEFIRQGMDVQNAACVFQLADTYAAPQLRASCLDYMSRCYDEVVVTEPFQQLSRALQAEVEGTRNDHLARLAALPFPAGLAEDSPLPEDPSASDDSVPTDMPM